MPIRTLFICGIAIALLGCDSGVEQAADPMVSAKSFVFYTIDPASSFDPSNGVGLGDEPTPEAQAKPDKRPRLHSYLILGSVEVDRKEDRRALLAALRKGMDESDGKMAKCFDPRHALRIEKESETIDYVICFECYQVETILPGSRSVTAVTESPKRVFNEFARRYGLTVAPE